MLERNQAKKLLRTMPIGALGVSNSMKKEEYALYLTSGHWKKLRNLKIRKFLTKHDRLRCSICGDDKGSIDLHHLSYKKIYDVETSDLRFVCRICHSVFHLLQDQGKVHFKEGGSHHHKFAKTKALVLRARGVLKPKKKYPADLKQQHLVGTDNPIRDALFDGIEAVGIHEDLDNDYRRALEE